jgi:hypothetical protein
LSPVLHVTPELTQGPDFLPNGRIALAGYLPLPAGKVKFDLQFQYVTGSWRLFGISARPAPVETGAIIATDQNRARPELRR